MPNEDGTSQGETGQSQGDEQQPKSQGDEKKPTADQGPAAPDRTAELEKKLKELERDNKKYRDQLKTHDDEKLSASERDARRIAELESELAEHRLQIQTQTMRAAFTDAATKAEALYPSDIWMLVNPADVTYDEAGNPTNAGQLVDAIKASRPALFGNGGPGSFDGGPRGPAAGAKPDMERLLRDAVKGV